MAGARRNRVFRQSVGYFHGGHCPLLAFVCSKFGRDLAQPGLKPLANGPLFAAVWCLRPAVGAAGDEKAEGSAEWRGREEKRGEGRKEEKG